MTDVNILAELYMQLGNFTETHALIARAHQAVKQQQLEVPFTISVLHVPVP